MTGQVHTAHTGMSDSYPSENERLISVKGVAAVKLWPAAPQRPQLLRRMNLQPQARQYVQQGHIIVRDRQPDYAS